MKKRSANNFEQEIEQNGIEVQSQLTKIYQNQDGSLPDISHLEVRRKSRWRLIVLSALIIGALLGGIGWFGFLLFGDGGQFDSGMITLELKIPQNISSGDEITYVLEYKNVEKVPLNDVEIILRYPEGFSFVSADPMPKETFNNVWTIGRLERNQSGRIAITGTIIGEVGSLKTINATASFQPENFSSSFKETAEATSQITSSILDITVEGPEKTLLEKKATYTIRYRNTADQALENVQVLVTYPENFVFQESKPEPSNEVDAARLFNNRWLIEKLDPNQEGEIEISGGYLASADSSSVDFKVQIGFLDDAADTFSLQQEKTVTTQIIGDNLAISIIANGSNQSQPINFGQTLVYSIVYKNLGQEELDDVVIAVTLDSDVLDWDTLQDTSNGAVKEGTITWSKDSIAKLDLLRPLEEGSIDFTIEVKPADDINIESSSLQVKTLATAKLLKIGEIDSQDLEIKSNEITSNINTDLELKVEGRYFTAENIPVGTGPLPPVVGQTTSFRIYWSVANSLHEVTDVTVTATLPSGVTWSNKSAAQTGSIKYTAGDRTVTWSIPSIAPNESFDDVSVWFDVSVTPTKEQARKLLILTSQSTLNATDELTDSNIIKVGKAITSNLDDDPIGGGKGLVVDITE